MKIQRTSHSLHTISSKKKLQLQKTKYFRMQPSLYYVKTGKHNDHIIANPLFTTFELPLMNALVKLP